MVLYVGRGERERLLELLVSDPNFEWLMIDASYIKVHPHQDAFGRGCTWYADQNTYL